MDQLERVLTRPRNLWTLWVATVAITLAFPMLAERFEITFLDGITSPEEARALVADLAVPQRKVHAWITATLDVLYPLVYAGFFAGSALFVFPGVGRSLAAVALAAIPVDLLEGVVQVLALTDQVDLLGAKAILTPAKFLLFLAGACLALVAWSNWLFRRLRSRT